MNKIKKDELLEILENLLLIPSPSKKEKGLGDFIINFIKDLGGEIYLDQSQKTYGGSCPTIFAKIKGDIPGEGVIFSAHMDVVGPNENLKIVKEKDIWKTDGKTTLGGDDKAGLAAILYAMKYMVLEKIPHKDIYAIFTPGEEIGMVGAKAIKWDRVRKMMDLPKNMIVLDNAGRSKYIAYQAPGSYQYKLEVFGKSSHAGIEPEKGLSAIKILSEIMAEMENGRVDEITTANISKLWSDFPTNVVPEKASCQGEIRSHSTERLEEVVRSYQDIGRKVCKKMGGKFKLSYKEDYPVLRSKDDLVFAKKFQEIYKSLGVKAKLQVIGGRVRCKLFCQTRI